MESQEYYALGAKGILDNLEEAIITRKSDNRIGLCNEPGNKILWKI